MRSLSKDPGKRLTSDSAATISLCSCFIYGLLMITPCIATRSDWIMKGFENVCEEDPGKLVLLFVQQLNCQWHGEDPP